MPTLEAPDDADHDNRNGRCNSDGNQLLSINTFDEFYAVCAFISVVESDEPIYPVVIGSDLVWVMERVRELFGIGVILGIYTDWDIVRGVLGVHAALASVECKMFGERARTYSNGYNAFHPFESQDSFPQWMQFCMEDISDIGP